MLVCIPTTTSARTSRSSWPACAVPQADVLVLDDNSPDGTGEVADTIAADDENVQVLHRPGKEGLGAAYLAGFSWGLERGYGAIVEMDADGSHQPEQLPCSSTRCRTRTSSSARAGCTVGRW